MRLTPALWLTWHYLRHVSRGISVTAPTEALQEPPPPPWIGQQRKVGSGFYEHPVKRLPKGWLICALFQEKNFSDLGETAGNFVLGAYSLLCSLTHNASDSIMTTSQ